MGLFNKRSKKDKKSVDALAETSNKLVDNEKKAVEKEEAKTKAEETTKSEEKSTAPTEERRFTIVVENVYKMKDDRGIVVSGNVHGTVNTHDKVYILHPLLPQGVEAEIEEIEEGPMNMVDTATNSRVGVRFASIKDGNTVPRFSVVTNIRPQSVPSPKYPAESPYLLGLSYEYNRLLKDSTFANIFTFAVFSSRYVTPVRMEIDMEKSSDGKAVLKQGSQISFRLLQKPDNKELRALPVFTDWDALRRWTNAFEGETDPKTFFLSFEQCADIGLKNGGFVINPFGPSPIYVSHENIKGILQMKANLDKKIDEEKKKENN